MIHRLTQRALLIVLMLTGHLSAHARTLDVGPSKPYSRLQAAASVAVAGDTILLHPSTFAGGDAIAALHGTEAAPIVIRASEPGTVVFRGGSSAFHLSDPAYVIIEGLVFEQQTGNGVNIDDAGTFDTPAHHIIIQRCEWRSMNATGNSDELKLSGLDDFIVRNCRFFNGADGGSLIDMVGCHRGTFEDNHFENGGSNCIQNKGGTSDIIIRRNRFINGGQRAVNIGGSTGTAFFRPQGADYEARRIRVYANVFVGSEAPIAFVGALDCEVVNNTIVNPTKWTVRILQESVSGFQPCGNNVFRNNVVVLTATGPFNVGPNTAPETFTISHNLWYLSTNTNWSGPNTPVSEPGRIVNLDPRFNDTLFRLQSGSPAIGAGLDVNEPATDYFNYPFHTPRSIGAVEAEVGLSVDISDTQRALRYDPSSNRLLPAASDPSSEAVDIFDNVGRLQWSGEIDAAGLSLESWSRGTYIARCGVAALVFTR